MLRLAVDNQRNTKLGRMNLRSNLSTACAVWSHLMPGLERYFHVRRVGDDIPEDCC
jgi:hypothetical protein